MKTPRLWLLVWSLACVSPAAWADSPQSSEKSATPYGRALALFDEGRNDECVKAIGDVRKNGDGLTQAQRAALDSRLVKSLFALDKFPDTRREAKAYLAAHPNDAEADYMKYASSLRPC